VRSTTYSAPLYATIARKFDDEPEEKVTVCLGEVPVMVGSKFCNLNGLSEEELAKQREDGFEFGGYFIINGNERIVRMLIMNKRNYPIAFQRPTFINRGRLFSTYAVQMRCVREDMFAQSITVHYLTDGNCMMKFIYHKQEFLIPIYIVLKAMKEVTDSQIYKRIVKGYFKNKQIGDQVEVILMDGEKYQLYSQNQCLAYIGSRFRIVLDGVQEDMTDVEVGRFLLERLILVHLPDFDDKFETMCLMIEKLYAVVGGECNADSLDSVCNQEVMLGGHLYGNILSEKLYDLLVGAKAKVQKDLRNPKFDINTLRSP